MTKITLLPAIKSYEEINVKLYERAQIEHRMGKEESAMNSKLEKIKNEFDEKTADDRAKKAVIDQQIEDFLIANKADFMEVRKKLLTHGTVGFQTTPPKVTFLNRKYNENTVIELLKKIFKGKFVRTKETIDKDEILCSVAQSELTDKKLAAVGLKVDQSEKTVIEINWESFAEVEAN